MSYLRYLSVLFNIKAKLLELLRSNLIKLVTYLKVDYVT